MMQLKHWLMCSVIECQNISWGILKVFQYPLQHHLKPNPVKILQVDKVLMDQEVETECIKVVFSNYTYLSFFIRYLIFNI